MARSVTASLGARWQRLSKRQQLIASVGLAIVVLVVADRLALRPLRHQLRRLRQEVQEMERRLIEAMIANQQAEAVNQAYAAYEPYAKPAGSPESELAGVLSEVESAVRQSGMVLLNLKPITAGEGAAHRVSVTLDGEGSPGQLVGLFDRIQRSPRLLKITDLTVRVSEGQTLRASFVISQLR